MIWKKKIRLKLCCLIGVQLYVCNLLRKYQGIISVMSPTSPSLTVCKQQPWVLCLTALPQRAPSPPLRPGRSSLMWPGGKKAVFPCYTSQFAMSDQPSIFLIGYFPLRAFNLSESLSGSVLIPALQTSTIKGCVWVISGFSIDKNSHIQAILISRGLVAPHHTLFRHASCPFRVIL